MPDATTPLDDLRSSLLESAAELRADRPAPTAQPTLERPPRAELGDYSTNAAMLLAPVLKDSPRAIAQRLGEALDARMGEHLDRVEVAGPGFLNVFLADAWYADAAARVLAAGDGFGAGRPARAEKVNVEFVSANPTGPLTAASGRHAAFGDSLARVLELAGHTVEREYYFNDSGSQVQRLGESIKAHAVGEPVPEDGYQGSYVHELAKQIPGAAEADVDTLAAEGVARIMASIRATLEAYRVSFDRWFLENSLFEGEPTAIQRALDVLERGGRLYRHEGALWLRTSEHGDDKDRVLLRSTGEPTYFAKDVAYLEDKLERGYDRLVYVLGADHHGYIGRMRAAAATLGVELDRVEIPILQFVHLVEGGERASMSKRRGDFVTLDELIGEIGVDATRFFMLQRSHDSTVDLDLDLARRRSNENPVYYVQYAHARIASVLAKAGEARVARALETAAAGAGIVSALDPAERELIKKLLAFPAEVAEAAERRAPHRIAAYALDLAQTFTAFYRDCRVVGAEPEVVESFRIALSVAAQRVIARSLGLLGVAAPASM